MPLPLAIPAIISGGLSIYQGLKAKRKGTGTSTPTKAWMLGSLPEKVLDLALAKLKNLPAEQARVRKLFEITPEYRRDTLANLVGAQGRANLDAFLATKGELSGIPGAGGAAQLNRLAKLREKLSADVSNRMISARLGLDEQARLAGIAGEEAAQGVERSAIDTARAYEEMLGGYAGPETATPGTGYDFGKIAEGFGNLISPFNPAGTRPPTSTVSTAMPPIRGLSFGYPGVGAGPTVSTPLPAPRAGFPSPTPGALSYSYPGRGRTPTLAEGLLYAKGGMTTMGTVGMAGEEGPEMMVGPRGRHKVTGPVFFMSLEDGKIVPIGRRGKMSQREKGRHGSKGAWGGMSNGDMGKGMAAFGALARGGR